MPLHASAVEAVPPSRRRRWAVTAAVHPIGLAIILVTLRQAALLLTPRSPLGFFDPLEDCAIRELEIPEVRLDE